MVYRGGAWGPDLLTIRAARLIGEADVIIWARSLVDEGVLEHAIQMRRLSSRPRYRSKASSVCTSGPSKRI
jgi:precorrin-4 methylase